ncbi:MAG: FAD-dependent oxidoreductase [Ginsengibacter sp.]
MELSSGLPYSLIKNGLMYDYPNLEHSLQAEVVILGGGISGALSAYYLSKAGFDCVVIDARSIGTGSSCASTSLLQYEIDVPLIDLQKKIGNTKAVRSYDLCAEAILKLKDIANDIEFKDFQLKNSLYYAANKKHVSFLKEEYQARKNNNFEVTLLDGNEVQNEYGFKAPAAILSELGGQTNAYAFAHMLHQYNLRNGCKIFDHTKITKIKHSPDGVQLKTENNHVIKAKKLVYATGYEVVNFINKKIVDLNSTYVTISQHTSTGKIFWKDDVLLWNTNDPYMYLRTTHDGRIMVGGKDEKFYNPARRDKLISTKSKELKKDFNNLFPEIDFNREFSWTGTFGTTKDGLPFIGPYKSLPNSFFSLGFGGNGITFSLIAAEIITDLISGKVNADAKIFAFERV